MKCLKKLIKHWYINHTGISLTKDIYFKLQNKVYFPIFFQFQVKFHHYFAKGNFKCNILPIFSKKMELQFHHGLQKYDNITKMLLILSSSFG